MPWLIYLGSSYSTAYTYKSMCDRNKLFEVLKYKVNCLLGTRYLIYKYFYEDYQMKLLNINDFVRCSCTCNVNDVNNIKGLFLEANNLF